MNVALLARLLWKRQQLRAHEHWRRDRLLAHQSRELARLRSFAYGHSPFYQGFHRGLTDRPLNELPILTKAMLMDHFDEVVTDPAVHLAGVRAFLREMRVPQRFQDRYWAASTSGSTGRPGIFVFNLAEWSSILAGMARTSDWAGMGAGLSRRTRMAVVASTVPWHMSAQTGPSVRSWWTPSMSLDATDPVPEIVAKLNVWQPEALIAYPSMLRVLAEEQHGGRLRIAPRSVMTSGEVLTDDTRRRATGVWGEVVFDTYAATETGSVASECSEHRGLHLFEDLFIVEVMDRDNRPVAPGVFGDKILVTVLSSRTLPLIRYEMSDSLRPATAACLCGLPFALVDGVQGRLEDVLYFSTATGREVAIHPNAFHRVMDMVPAEEWQVISRPEGVMVLIRDSRHAVDTAAVADALRRELTALGAQPLTIRVERVDAIPRNVTGKAPLIVRETRPPPSRAVETASRCGPATA